MSAYQGKGADAIWIGIRRHGAGWRASVSRGRGASLVQQHFSIETPPRVMQDWRADTKAALRLTRKQRATAGTFEHDAKRYLAAITALSTYETRRVDIARWQRIFGTRRRDTITASEIRHWRDRWMKEPRKDHPAPLVDRKTAKSRRLSADPLADTPYAASTINHWLRALSNMWTVLDGRRAPNPVREVPEVGEPDPVARRLDYALVEQIINAVSSRSRPVKGQPNKGTVSLTQLRLRVLAYTGLTYSQLGGMKREDVDLENGSMLVRRRRKGKGAKPRRLGLTPLAIDAFAALDAANGWGKFSGGSVRKVFMLACAKVRKENPGLPPIRVYDLRHLFGASVYRATKSLEAVRNLLSHEKLATTERYALDAVSDVIAAHVAQVTASQKVKPLGK